MLKIKIYLDIIREKLKKNQNVYNKSHGHSCDFTNFCICSDRMYLIDMHLLRQKKTNCQRTHFTDYSELSLLHYSKKLHQSHEKIPINNCVFC